MECLIIEPDFQRQSDEPVCDACAKSHCQRLAERLGREEMERQKTLPKQPPSDLDVLTQRNQILETWAREQEAKQKEQEAKMAKMEANIEKMASLLAQLISKQ